MPEQNLFQKLYEVLPFDSLYNLLQEMPTLIPIDGNVSYEILKTKRGQTIHSITGQHFSRRALKILHYELRPLVEQAPNDWLFLIEGHAAKNPSPEAAYSKTLASRFGIPLADPIKNPFEKSVVRRAIAQGEKEQEIHTALTIELLKINPDASQIYDTMYQALHLDQDYLHSLIKDLFSQVRKDPESYKRRLDHLQQVYLNMVEPSNYLSRKKLERILRKNMGKTSMITCLGDRHRPILDDL